MNRFDVLDLEIIKNANIPLTTLKRQITNMLESSIYCSAIVESAEKNSGKYRIILEGKLNKANRFEESHFFG